MRLPSRSIALALVVAALACGDDDGPPSNGSVPGTGSWDVRASLGSARQEMPSALVDGRIYTPGGYDSQGGTVGTLEIYDVAEIGRASCRERVESSVVGVSVTKQSVVRAHVH